MIKLFLALNLLFVSNLVFSFQLTDKTGSTLNSISNPGATVYEKRYIPRNEGSKFLFSKSQEATIFAKGGVYKKSINIDLEKYQLNFTKNNQTQYWELYKLDSVLIGNNKIYPIIGHLSGCLIVYQEKDFSLILSKKAELKSSNYNSALDTGNRNNTWTVNEEYYISISEIHHYYELNDGLIRVPTSKKKFSKLFKSPQSVLSFIKEKRIDINKTQDLILLLNRFSVELVSYP